MQLIFPAEDEQTDHDRRTVARIRAVSREIAEQRDVLLDGADLNDVLRALQDLLLAMKRAKAAAHNRRRRDKEVDGDGG